MTREVCQFIFDLGREVERMAAKREAELADAIDAGYAMGYQAEHRARNTRPGDVSRKRRFELPGAESGGPLLFRRIRPVRSGGRL